MSQEEARPQEEAPPEEPARKKCSFCDKSSKEVPLLVEREDGPGPGPVICSECVYMAAVKMVTAGWVPPHVKMVWFPPKP